jgi:alpha-L-fucosidase
MPVILMQLNLKMLVRPWETCMTICQQWAWKPDDKMKSLKEMGVWLSKNGEAIYGTRGGPWKSCYQTASTRKGGKIYLHLPSKKDGAVTVPALPVAIKSARLLNGPAIAVTTTDGAHSLVIPDNSWDEIDTITFHKGGSLGAHFKASFQPVTTSAVRLNLLEASDGPTISEIRIETP